jgi:hypothetical protein
LCESQSLAILPQGGAAGKLIEVLAKEVQKIRSSPALQPL